LESEIAQDGRENISDSGEGTSRHTQVNLPVSTAK
jgi:hypothetical protein